MQVVKIDIPTVDDTGGTVKVAGGLKMAAREHVTHADLSTTDSLSWYTQHGNN